MVLGDRALNPKPLFHIKLCVNDLNGHALRNGQGLNGRKVLMGQVLTGVFIGEVLAG